MQYNTSCEVFFVNEKNNMFLHLNFLCGHFLVVKLIMSPLRRGGGHIVFICLFYRSFLSARYLLNHWMDLDQTGTETSLGQPNGVIRFQ